MRPLRRAALLVDSLLRLVACRALRVVASFLRLAASFRGVSPRLIASFCVSLRLLRLSRLAASCRVVSRPGCLEDIDAHIERLLECVSAPLAD